MIQVQVIHSEARKDRLELIEKEAVEQGFTINFHPAVFSSKPARGISQAHRNVVAWAKENNLHHVIVLEDDCHFTELGAFSYFVLNIPEDYDIFLGGIYIIKKMNADGSIRDFSGMTCYIVHNKFYDTFLSVNPNLHIDSALWGKGKYILCSPMVALQWETFSDNHKMILDNNEMIDGNPRFFGGRKFY